MAGRRVAIVLCLALLGNAFSVPADFLRRRRQVTQEKNVGDNEVTSQEITVRNSVQSSTTSSPNTPSTVDDDDDDDFEPVHYPTGGGGGGSNIFSLLNLISALFPASSGSNMYMNMLRQFLIKHQHTLFPKILPRKTLSKNKIKLDSLLKPPPIRQELEESDSKDDSNGSDDEESNENNGGEASMEGNNSGSKQESNSDDDYDSDEPPGGGDGQGGGILGLLAGLSGGEDGQSDLGSLLATVGGIVAQLSGDGVDINALIASGLGLFVGLLSEGNENPGAVVASYLVTSLDTLSGGGSKNNGAFFGSFLSKLLKGTSGPLPASSEENGNKMPEIIDSAGFLASFLTALLGDMSKGSSGGGGGYYY